MSISDETHLNTIGTIRTLKIVDLDPKRKVENTEVLISSGPLSNPFEFYDEKDALSKYRDLIMYKLRNKINPVTAEMERIGQLILAGTNVDLIFFDEDSLGAVNHGTIIKEIIDEAIRGST